MRVGRGPDDKNRYHYPRRAAAVRLVAALFLFAIMGTLLFSLAAGEISGHVFIPTARIFSGDKSPGEKSEDADIRKIALTYDDGPDPVYTEALLAVLEEEDVRATFFLLGQEIAGQEETVRKMHAAGHVLGNHTYSHADLLKMSEEEALEQLEKTSAAIEACTGEYPQYFRPPFGRRVDGVNERSPMLMVMWTLDTRDWECQDTGTIVENIVQNVKENDIILMHDGYGATVEATRQVIPILKEKGYTFVTVEELMMCP